MTAHGYTRVPGSDRLKTAAMGQDPAIEALRHQDRSALGGVEIDGQWLGRCLVRGRYVPVLDDVYDRLALQQTAEEQALYGHLYRLAVGDERNHCRVSRRDLCARTQLSERRLGKALAGLIAKDHVRHVHRDRQGTLYRVRLPHEIFGERPDGSVQLVQVPAATHATRSRDTSTSGAAAPRRRRSRVASTDDEGPPSPAALTARFVQAYGGPGRSPEDVLDEVLELTSDGHDLETIWELLRTFGETAPQRTPATEIGPWLRRRGLC